MSSKNCRQQCCDEDQSAQDQYQYVRLEDRDRDHDHRVQDQDSLRQETDITDRWYTTSLLASTAQQLT